MRIYKYVIINTNPLEVTDLEAKLRKFPLLELSKVCSTLEEVVGVFYTEQIDLVFLEINLGGENGLSLLKSGINFPSVIVISNRIEDAVDCFDIGTPVDFLLKPFSFDRLLQAVNRALSLTFRSNYFVNANSIFLKTGRKIQRFNYQSIDYIESYGMYVKVYTTGNYYIVNERLGSLAKLLPQQYFMRVHKSYILNSTKITSFDRSSIYIGQIKIPIGISYRLKLEGLLKLLDTQENTD